MIKKTLKIIFVYALLLFLWSILLYKLSKDLCVYKLQSSYGMESKSKLYRVGLRRPLAPNSLISNNRSFPVDLVYTWVNGSDPRHLKLLARVTRQLLLSKSLTPTRARNLDFRRFADNGGLRYSLRSLEKYANWIRHVFIVTNGQIPNWLNLTNPRVTIVRHEEIFDDPNNLPTLSSPAIEHNIHKIRGISDRFIYMNDDVFFGRKVELDDFYTKQNGTKVYMSELSVPQCNERCRNDMIKNDVCDDVCNHHNCAWDGGDCYHRHARNQDMSSSDDYTSSVLYTNAAYNRAFGQRERRLTLHVPLFIDKKINEDLVKMFPNEVRETCRQKIRSPLDLQFGFSYMHFLMNGNRFEPKVKSSTSAFISITVNETKTRNELTLLSNLKRKFNCINDDIDYSKKSAASTTVALLQEFYESMFPEPSSFEIIN